MVVPAAVSDRHQTHAGLDQTARHEQTHARLVAAVFVLQRVGFFFQGEGLARLLAADQLVSVLVEGIHRRERVGFFQRLEVRVHRVQNPAAAGEAVFRDAVRQRQVLHAEIPARRIRAEAERTVSGAEIAAARELVRLIRDTNVGRQIVPGAELVRDHASEARVGKRRARAVAGEHVVRAAFVRRLAVRHAADEAQFVRDLRRILPQLAEEDAVDVGFDAAVGTSVFRRRERFRVKALLMRHPARQEDVDDALRLTLHGLITFQVRVGLHAEEIRKGETESAADADVQKAAAAESVGESGGGVHIQ